MLMIFKRRKDTNFFSHGENLSLKTMEGYSFGI